MNFNSGLKSPAVAGCLSSKSTHWLNKTQWKANVHHRWFVKHFLVANLAGSGIRVIKIYGWLFIKCRELAARLLPDNLSGNVERIYCRPISFNPNSFWHNCFCHKTVRYIGNLVSDRFSWPILEDVYLRSRVMVIISSSSPRSNNVVVCCFA